MNLHIFFQPCCRQLRLTLQSFDPVVKAEHVSSEVKYWKHPSHQICLHQILQMSCRCHYKIPIEATPSFTTSFMWNVKVSYILVLNNINIVSLLHVSSCLSWTRRWLSRVAMRRVMLAVDDRRVLRHTLPLENPPAIRFWPIPLAITTTATWWFSRENRQ